MSDGHLTDEEFADALAGEPSTRVSAHLAACPRCAEEASALSETVRGARNRRVSFLAAPRPVAAGPASFGAAAAMRAASFGAAALLAATLLLGASGVFRKADPAVRPVSAAAPNDESLLEALENVEARIAPAPLASALPERERLSPERRTSPR